MKAHIWNSKKQTYLLTQQSTVAILNPMDNGMQMNNSTLFCVDKFWHKGENRIHKYILNCQLLKQGRVW
jgi:hypothetical protein